MPFFKVFWYDSTRGMNPRSADCEAGALTTTPSDQEKRKLARKDIVVLQALTNFGWSMELAAGKV